MRIAQTYHNHIDQYGPIEGLSMFISTMSFMIHSQIESLEDFNNFCESMIEEKPFPNCLTWCEIKREMNENINQAVISQ